MKKIKIIIYYLIKVWENKNGKKMEEDEGNSNNIKSKKS